MALFVEGDNVSTAWVEALDRLLAGDGEAVNLTVAIADPTTEVPAIRSVVDAFIDGRPSRSTRSRSSGSRRSLTRSFPNRSTSSASGREPRNISMSWNGDHVGSATSATGRGRISSGWSRWPLEKPKKGQQAKTFNQLDQAVVRLRRLREQGRSAATSSRSG